MTPMFMRMLAKLGLNCNIIGDTAMGGDLSKYFNIKDLTFIFIMQVTIIAQVMKKTLDNAYRLYYIYHVNRVYDA